jgi:protoporphyrinogen oxidase
MSLPQSELPESIEILVVGAGPTGLGAAYRLSQLNHPSWLLVDSAHLPGGLARTDVTEEGFLFDMGGHVVFSHYKFFDQLLEHALGSEDENWTTLERVSYVWIKNRWVPYPFQNNLYCLPVDDRISCIKGVIDAAVESQVTKSHPRNFDEWILRVMGEGIANLFMRRYNFKVWAYPTTELQCEWLGDRVATVDVKKVIENVIRNKPDAGWGPNAIFKFPKHGGTGGIYLKLAHMLPQDRIKFNRSLVGIDFNGKIARFSDGWCCQFKSLLTTSPLDLTLHWLGRDDLVRFLRYSSTHVVGIGLRGTNPHEKKCWMYFPEDNCPFYRCTVFSLYSEFNCPGADVELSTLRLADGSECEDKKKRPGPYWSLLFEVSESSVKPVNLKTIVQETIQGAVNTKMIGEKEEIVSIYHHRLERGYPTPSLDRDKAVTEGLQVLKRLGVWSRGRFGAWKYEVGNQDHSVMQGVEAVDNILRGSVEMTLLHPNITNGQRNIDIEFAHKSIGE